MIFLIRIIPKVPKSNTQILLKSLSTKTSTDPTAGGVWAQTSAKRDKLSELKSELSKTQKTLDDAATPKEKLDLNFIDGLKLVAKVVDESSWDVDKDGIGEIKQWLLDSNTIITTMEEKKDEMDKELLNEGSFQRHLADGNAIVQRYIQPNNGAFTSLVDFVEATDHILPFINNIAPTEEAFEQCVLFYRLCLTKSAMEVLSTHWGKLLEYTSEDLDRAAVAHQPTPSLNTIPISKVNAVLQSYISGNCIDQCKSWWDLYDKDDDTRLDQSEMDNVVYALLQTYQEALKYIFPTIIDTLPISSDLSWRKRRQQTNHYKKLKSTFQKTLDNHFDLEVETPHRLRCIYAWADKSHQDNKMDSILVENNESITGKKRYVELSPKISYEEFRMEQEKHFGHLDRIGQEFLGSFREDVLMIQGGRRQNLQLRREVLLFFTIVTIADFGILAL